MDLTTTYPRSPKDRLAGLVSLKRVIDKAKASNAGSLGEYHYDCPHDRPLFDFLGVDAQTFAGRVRDLQTDEAIGQWVSDQYLKRKSQDEIDAFNYARMHWSPEPGSDSKKFFDSERERLGRPDLQTWFDLLDVDEGREVRDPTVLHAGVSG